MEGVKWLRAINTTDRPQRPVIITITDKDEVTSFNIISNNQIAIPGKYMSLISNARKEGQMITRRFNRISPEVPCTSRSY